MTFISKQVDTQLPMYPIVEIPYELYTTETALDESLNEVNILKKIGTFTKEGLERDKNYFLERIAEIDEKLVAINSSEAETNIFYAAKTAAAIKEPVI